MLMAPAAENKSSLNESSLRRLTIRQVLYHPLTWLAVGCHAALLLVPFDPSPPAAAPETIEEEAPEEAAIDVLNLSEIATAEPPTQASSEPPSAPPPAASQPAPVRSATAPAASAAAPAPASNAPAAPAAPAAPVAPGGATKDPLPPAYDPSADQDLFIGNLGAIGLTDYTASQGLPPAGLLRHPENASYFLNGSAPAAGARDARWMDKGPDDVLNQLKATYEPGGISFNQLDSYGGEPLYQLVTAEGQPFMYISLVSLKGSSLVVIWQSNPLS